MLKTKFDNQILGESLINQIGALFFDAWIIMLAAGGLSHKLAYPKLAIGYPVAILINLIAIALLIQPHHLNSQLKAIAKQIEDLQAKL